MDLNAVPPRDQYSVARDQQPRPSPNQSVRGEVGASMRSEPSTAPESDGVLATFESGPPDDSERGAELFGKERDADALRQRTERDQLAALISARLPTNAQLDIDVDPDTHDPRFLVRNRHTGELVREIPERELTELLRQGPTSPGRFVDRTM